MVMLIRNEGFCRAAIKELTPRQKEVLALLSQGFSNPAIAERLVLGPKSVENYINLVYRKLRLADLKEADPRVMAMLIFTRYRT